jgi:NADPH:quinone reductase
MKAAVVDAPGPAKVLKVKEVPVPSLPSNHVLVALEYAGVGIWDAEQRAGSFGKIKTGTILGADGSGTIAAVGSGVKEFKVGDRVFAYSYGNSSGGFYAEYVSVPVDRVGLVPATLSMVVAGGMPCVALTALSGLEALKVGQRPELVGVRGERGCRFACGLAGAREGRERDRYGAAGRTGVCSFAWGRACHRRKFL